MTLSNRYKIPGISSGIINTKPALGLGILYISGGGRNLLQNNQFMLNKYVIDIETFLCSKANIF